MVVDEIKLRKELDYLFRQKHKCRSRYVAMSRVIDEVVDAVKNCSIPDVGLTLCGSFDPDNSTSSATKCKCGREKWEHPKAAQLRPNGLGVWLCSLKHVCAGKRNDHLMKLLTIRRVSK